MRAAGGRDRNSSSGRRPRCARSRRSARSKVARSPRAAKDGSSPARRRASATTASSPAAAPCRSWRRARRGIRCGRDDGSRRHTARFSRWGWSRQRWPVRRTRRPRPAGSRRWPRRRWMHPDGQVLRVAGFPVATTGKASANAGRGAVRRPRPPRGCRRRARRRGARGNRDRRERRRAGVSAPRGAPTPAA